MLLWQDRSARKVEPMPPIAYYTVARGKDQTVKYEIRHSMVMLALKQGIRPTARYYGVTRNTVRKWLRRYQETRIDGLQDRSRAPHHVPHKTSVMVEKKVLRLKRKLKRFGSRRLVRDYAPGCSHGAFDRICREHKLLRRRKRKRDRRNDLRAIKARYGFGRRNCNDTKHLNDIAEYWPQARKLRLPWYQYSHRDVRTGTMFLGFADELSLSHAAVFTEVLVAWYLLHGVRLRDGVWLHDGGSEYIGSWQAKEPSAFQRVLTGAGIKGLEIPKTTYNAEVETIHNTIEFEFFELDRFRDRRDFFRKASGYQLWYNWERRNCNREDQSPREILAKVAPHVDLGILTLPVLDIDELLALRVTFAARKKQSEGHDVPWLAPQARLQD
jgi:transposase-like protein